MVRLEIFFARLFWSFAYFEVNEFVPVSFVAVGAFDVVPSVPRNPPNTCPHSYNPSDLLEGGVTLGTKER